MSDGVFLWIGSVPVLYQATEEIDRSHRWSVASHDTIEDVARLQFIGRDGAGMRVRVRAHWLLGMNPAVVLAQLLELGDSGATFAVQTQAGEILGWFMMTSLNESRKWTLPEGQVLWADYDLTLEPDRPPAGVAQPTPEAVNVDPEYDHAPTPIDTDRDHTTVSIDEIVRRA